MPVDRGMIENKLENLKTFIRKLEKMEFTVAEIQDDEDIQDLLDRRMQLAIETCIDIATHIAANLQLPKREVAADVFDVLANEGIINSELSEKMRGAVGLRNILVHEYAKIDYELAYADLKKKLGDLRDFAAQIFGFLEKEG
ncbi:DUF86 domain-containing protein [Candidatus Curtissbacteria bacterium]|nr:DUF86 domain-containing protein [Candidatus Curtissbacteria bacterium]